MASLRFISGQPLTAGHTSHFPDVGVLLSIATFQILMMRARDLAQQHKQHKPGKYKVVSLIPRTKKKWGGGFNW